METAIEKAKQNMFRALKAQNWTISDFVECLSGTEYISKLDLQLALSFSQEDKFLDSIEDEEEQQKVSLLARLYLSSSDGTVHKSQFEKMIEP
jgi:hypothetical protein